MSLRSRMAGLLFAFYKRGISPMLHGVGVSQCIFLPTCSEYAYVAVVRHGWVRGTVLAARRIGRCHPFGTGGLDEVP